MFTVTNPVAETSLLTIEELRAATGVAGSAEDASLMALGRQLSESIAVSCGVAWDGEHARTLLSEECEESFKLDRPASFVQLARRPVTAIAAVAVDGSALDGAEYEVDKATGLVFSAGAGWACAKIVVTFTAGFATVPGPLKLAASKLATALYVEAGRDPNLKRIDIPDVMEKEFWVAPVDDPLLSTEIQDLLAPYKQVW